jgi:LytS/YehU family sensor histidine kinase
MQPEPIRVLVSVTGSSVRVQVVDSGQGFARDVTPLRPEDDAGWGLYMVDQIADRWGMQEDGKTTVWFELDR